jgi:hypothetical protein
MVAVLIFVAGLLGCIALGYLACNLGEFIAHKLFGIDEE